MKISDVNLNDLDAFEKATPHEWFTLLRKEDPLHLHKGPDGEQDYYCVTKYEDLKHVSKSPEVFSSEKSSALLRDPDENSLAGMQQIMINMDPPRHRQYRATVNKAFTPRMMIDLQPAVKRIVDGIVDNVIEKGECDFVEDIAAILPMEVICEMVGVPQEDRRAIYEIGNRMVGFDDPELQDETVEQEPADYEAASAEMFMYASKLKQRAIDHPGNDLATRLLNAEVDGHRLNDMEFNSFFLLLVIAGNETTRTVTTNGMLDLLRHPDQYRMLREDPSLIPGAVEEMLRFNPAVTSFRRQVMQDTELRGVQLKEGDKLALWYPSVNRDEEVFDDPHTFDIERDPNPHLSFGVGEHFCLGANLARMELQKIFEGIITRLPELELAAEPRRLRSNFINGVKEMRVRFTPGSKKAA
ncbi:MAG: cytochrome P450 [Myxococcales bacterium]|nr:cytochrome P450 [Myxococcales bacterium]